MSQARHYWERTSGESAQLLDQLAERGEDRPVLLRGATIVSMDGAVGDFAEGDILIRGSDIAEVAQSIEAPDDAIVLELRGAIVIPGLVDGHRHSWQNSLRRLIPDATIDEYMETTHFGVAQHYRPEDMYVGNLVSLWGALDSGVTTVLDFSHNTRTPEHSDAVFESYPATGIRAVHASAAPNFGEWAQHWPDDLERLRDRYVVPGGLVSLRMAVDAARVHRIDRLLDIAREAGLGITFDGVVGRASSDEVAWLGREGKLAPDVTLVHCTALEDDAWDAIQGSGARVTLSVTSDEQIGLGDAYPPIQTVLDRGILPALSVDVEISLATDMFAQMRATLTTQRMAAAARQYRGDPDAPARITTADVLEYATVGGARANGLESLVGSITPGKRADLVVITAEEANNLPLNNAIGTVVLAADTRNVDTVFVGGRVRKWAGELVGIDLARLRDLSANSRDYLLGVSGLTASVVRSPSPRGNR
jgi:cytosine/adenosine deaminase-related metal-dependent hydrolase